MSDEVQKRKITRDEAWELTDQIRQGYESIHSNRMEQAARLAKAYETDAWEPMGYSSFDEYHYEEFGDDLQHQRLELEERLSAVKMLNDSGMAKTKIAEILGIHRNSVTNLIKKIDAQEAPDAQRCASNEVDAAGQDVEEVGHIDDDTKSSHIELVRKPTVIINLGTSEEYNKDNEPAEEVDRFAGINFDSLILPTPNQIIQADPSEDTPDYFTPRSVQPDWSPPMVGELPPAPVKRYDDDQPEFLDEPMKIEKPVQPHKSDDKHCRTCACNLLP